MTKIIENIRKIFNREALTEFVSLNILLLCIMFATRIVSYVEFAIRANAGAGIITHILSGTLYDVVLLAHIIAWCVVPFIILYRFIPLIIKKIYIIFIYIYAIATSLLLEYFCNMSKPLDHIIYMYSPEEINDIIFSSVSFSIIPIIFFFAMLLLTIVICRLWKKVKINHIAALCVTIVSIIIAISVNYKGFLMSESLYKNHTDFCYGTNQISYSYFQIDDYEPAMIDNDINMEEIRRAAKNYQSQFTRNTYTGHEYPYNHYFTDPDVLGGFISRPADGEMPNFVFIIVESLGRKLTGVDFPTISFTPFIDSLAGKGLFWENCLSTAERTFEVLPSIFASAPYGTHGFANCYYPIPCHNSLLQDFAKNGYTTSFFYGGSSGFDGQDAFLKTNNISYIMQPELDTTDSGHYQELKNGNRWGLDDGEMFAAAVEHKKHNVHKPFADIYMTLSTHEPFIAPEKDKYLKIIDEMLSSNKTMSDYERGKIEANKNIFSCFLYADDCIRELINEYQKNGEFDNTIFLIVGDHRMCPLGDWNQLWKYHVPLIIYSPLISTPRTMKAVVSHLDITPTINSYLSNNFENYKINRECQWMGTSLDTAEAFRCRKIMPFILNNRDIIEYINDTIFLTRGRLFVVRDNLKLEAVDDENLLSKMKENLEAEKTLSKYAVYYNSLQPVSGMIEDLIYSFNTDFEENENIEEMISDKGNRVASLGSEKEYGSLCHSFILNDNYKALNISAKFNFKNLNPDKTTPLFIISIEKDGKNIYYEARSLLHEKDKPSGNWTIFNDRECIRLSEDCKDCEMKIYLWNRDKGDIVYDNVNISIYK